MFLLSELQNRIFLDRYALKDQDGAPIEHDPSQMWSRVATALAAPEAEGSRTRWSQEFYDLLRDFKFLPGGRILSGAGTPHQVTFYNCFVIPSPEDSRGGILDNIKLMTEIMCRGGGVGVNLSSLRPEGSYIKTVNGHSSGPVSWAEIYSVTTGDVIQQGGSRRGALMLMLDDAHPDILRFIERKKRFKQFEGATSPRYLEYANISVATSDAFMDAVKANGPWHLHWKGEIARTIAAQDLFLAICESAWRSADPGLVFTERCQKESNSWYFEEIQCVNPCGEQPLPPYGVCNLGSLNLAAYVTDSCFEYGKFAQDVATATRFLDNVIDTTHYFLPENAKAQRDGARRVGLGTMGLADCLIKLGVRYGSDESLSVIQQIFATLRDAAYETSCQLGRDKGSFPRFEKDLYLQGSFIRKLPRDLQKSIGTYGMRNSHVLTQAPTGTTSLLAGVSSGIEPVFDFTMRRRDRTGETVIHHPLYADWLNDAAPGVAPPSYFVAANQLTATEHIDVQAMVQRYNDSAISKTVNLPAESLIEDVWACYLYAYDMGCKGITVYRDGSRDAVLTHVEPLPSPPETVTPIEIRTRPEILHGKTIKKLTPVGTAFITLNHDSDGHPSEVFVTIGKAGSDIAADAEAIGRLASLALRIPSPMTPRQIADAIVTQLGGIGGATSAGFGPRKVRSVADAISQVLASALDGEEPNPRDLAHPDPSVKSGGFCPQCQNASLVVEEGCEKCYACGFSRC